MATVTSADGTKIDFTRAGDDPPPVARLASIDQPVVVITGTILDPGMTQREAGFFDAAADAITEAVPNAERRVLPGLGHSAESAVFAADLSDFSAR